MNIGFVTVWNHNDVMAYSGTSYSMWKAFESAGCKQHFIDGLRHNKLNLLRQSAKQVLQRYIFRRRYNWGHDPRAAKCYANQVVNQLNRMRGPLDWVVSPSSIPLAFVDTDYPMALWADANFKDMVGYYLHDLCEESIRDGIEVEQNALDRCALAIYTSQWAADGAVNHYKVDASKVHVINYGANIECDRTDNSIVELTRARTQNVCNLLFVGTDWHRKGGDRALKICAALNRLGVSAVLRIVGCDPDLSRETAPHEKLGFVKRTTEGRARLDTLFREAHFLVLPSRADCTPMVVAEANSFGVPCVSVRTGGIPSIVSDDVNGRLFDDNSAPEEYAAWILDTFTDAGRYGDLTRRCFAEYTSRLSWRAAVPKVLALMEQVGHLRRARRSS
jgi:glycosyltransferase involved in cell wall biosynthesis